MLIKYMTSCPQDFHETIQESVEHFMRVAGLMQARPVDFTMWPWFWAFDTTFAILFGKEVGFMQTQTDIDNLVASFREVVRPAILLGQIPELIPWTLGSDRFMRFAKLCFRLPDPTKSLLEVCSGPVSPFNAENGQRIEKEIDAVPHSDGYPRNSFLQRLLHHEDDEGRFNREEMINLLFEGL